MELRYPDAAKRFADEVRAFMRAELPPTTRDKVFRRQKITPAEQREWQGRLCARGWACPGWPAEYGGPGFDALQRHIFDTVASEEGAPAAIPFGESMIAPVLFHVGSPAQKAHLLPRIRTLEYYFCQGFSEPGAGSDLASLKTRAVLDGDVWRIDGQKMWTSMAHHANMIFMLVRTSTEGKPQEGISMLVFPIDQKGITIRPIITMDGGHSTNEVFFDDVRVPADSLIGEANKGWNYAKLLLGHERLSIARIGQSKRELRLLKAMAGEQTVDGEPLLRRRSFREKVSMLEVELLALEITALRMIQAGGSPGVEANMLKIKGSEIQQGLTELMMDALGPWAMPFDGERGLHDTNEATLGPADAASVGPNFLSTRVVTIYGGSNEIQRNVISKSLGL
jgi:alkylation response protein AidB-like acyl-CoA dehydrogenase